jgi:hypothetical protein
MVITFGAWRRATRQAATIGHNHPVHGELAQLLKARYGFVALLAFIWSPTASSMSVIASEAASQPSQLLEDGPHMIRLQLR